MRIPGVWTGDAEPAGERVGTALLVPGRAYPAVAPLLFLTAQVLLQHGWRVVQHWWDPPAHESDEQTLAFVRGEVEAALPDDDRVLVVGKSLGTIGSVVAAERRLPGLWLTPVNGMPAVAAAIAANPAPQLLVAGTADPVWEAEPGRALAAATCRVVEIPDADHAMLVPGDAVRGAEAHVEVTRAVDAWVGSL